MIITKKLLGKNILETGRESKKTFQKSCLHRAHLIEEGGLGDE